MSIAFSKLAAHLSELATQRTKDIRFLKNAVDMAKEALSSNEVAVGAVFVADDKVITGSHNLTNVSKNATTHCEINCIRELAKREPNNY